MKIYKYRLDFTIINEPQTVPMPSGARILDVQFQDGALVAWAEVEPSNPLKDRLFQIVFTGSDKPEPITLEGPGPTIRRAWTYVATPQREGYVFHVYVAPDSRR